MDVAFSVVAAPGPAFGGSVATIPYFVAAADPQRGVYVKRNFEIAIGFPEDPAAVRHRELVSMGLPVEGFAHATAHNGLSRLPVDAGTTRGAARRGRLSVPDPSARHMRLNESCFMRR